LEVYPIGLCIGLSQPLRVFRSQRGGIVGIAVDETKVKIERRGEPIYVFLWAARDVDTKEVLAFRASFTKSSLNAEIFLKQVLEYCENKPLFLVDKGPWYRDAFERLGLEYRHETP
jgi:transposase-like protein